MRLAEKKEMLIDVVSYPDISANENPFGLDSKWYNKKMVGDTESLVLRSASMAHHKERLRT